MESEIELKLLVPDGISENLLMPILKRLASNIETEEFSLFNQYFDTPEWELSRHGIGLRVRSSEKGTEQTIKTSGTSVGGLHQRPEYNVDIDSLEPELDLFDSIIWPDGLDIPNIQSRLTQIFNTDFVRKVFLLQLPSGSLVEMVFDSGAISTAENSTPISEIELELKKGSAIELFDLAKELTELGPTQLGNLSKAARGFQLAKSASVPAKSALVFVGVEDQDDGETAFCKTLEYTLNYWQRSENLYMQSHKIADLMQVYTGIRITEQCLRLFKEILNSKTLAKMHGALTVKLRKWSWVEQIKSFKALRSKRGMYSKKLTQHDALLSYLRGLQDGTLNLSKPQLLITHKDNTKLQLKLARLLLEKPWRQESSNYADAIHITSNRILADTWSVVFPLISKTTQSSNEYCLAEKKLRSALHTDLYFGNLYSSIKREPFRAPWLDILDGIVELQTIDTLRSKLRDSDVDDKSDLLSWSEIKRTSLLVAMEKSKAVALEMEIYWQK